MKSIEKRGGNFATNYETHGDDGGIKLAMEIARESYITGAKEEHEIMTRWNDPKEVPEPGKVVLVRRTTDSPVAYDLGHIDKDGEWVDTWCGLPLDDKIIGWREIHE